MHNYAEILEAHRRLHELQYQHWLNYELFTPQWWAQLAVVILSWLVWWKLVDKSRIAAAVTFGLFIIFQIMLMDATGIYMEYWVYPIKLLPVIPHFLATDWGLLPALHMLVYQAFPRWRSFLAAEITLALLLAFVGEPIAEWIGIYRPLHWPHLSSLPLYAAKGLVAKLLTEKLFPAGRRAE